MTAFSRVSGAVCGADIVLEMRSVNHRYFDLALRLPRGYSFFEEEIKNALKSQVSRGKVECSMQIVSEQEHSPEITPQVEIARNYLNALRILAKELEMGQDVSLSLLASFPDVLSVRAPVADEEALRAAFRPLLRSAVDALVVMREQEGSRLLVDMEMRLSAIAEAVLYIKNTSADWLPAYRGRLTERMQEILADSAVDENRILLEAALYADRTAVDEETVRLESHIAQFRAIATKNESVGRSLDFLLQEMNREINTIGSKVSRLEVTERVVEVKSELEKLREQVQNIE